MPKREVDDPTETYSFLLMAGEETPLFVRFEPSGPDYEIASDDHLRIQVTSPSHDPVQVVTGSNWVNIWGAPSTRIAATNAKGESLHFLL